MKMLENIRKIRKYKNITQDFISYELGITQEAYSKLENGISKLSFEQVEKICEILEISLVSLLQNNILYKNKKKDMSVTNYKTMNEYYDTIYNRDKILELWLPILKDHDLDKNKNKSNAMYFNKNAFYRQYTKINEPDEKASLLSYSILKTLNNINFEFDEFDVEEINHTITLNNSIKFKKPELIENENYRLYIFEKLEQELISNICKYLTKIATYSYHNKLYYQIPFLKNLKKSFDKEKSLASISVDIHIAVGDFFNKYEPNGLGGFKSIERFS